MVIREKECKALVEEICSKTDSFIRKCFTGENSAKIDTSKLVLSGHSFGGITAVSVQRDDPRVKAAIGMDVWFFPHYKELNAKKFGIKEESQATCLLTTEAFPSEYPYESKFDDYDRFG